VLVVEDQAEVRQLMVETLTSAGFRVLGAAGGAEAVAVATGHAGPLPLLVTDVIMPEMSGLTLARRILDAHPETRVLYMSGYAAEAFDREAEGPLLVLLQKPFTVNTLTAKVREVLDAEGA
jgi:two-component system, cell cycle sensor histidine kinase and response regulator CckA